MPFAHGGQKGTTRTYLPTPYFSNGLLSFTHVTPFISYSPKPPTFKPPTRPLSPQSPHPSRFQLVLAPPSTSTCTSLMLSFALRFPAGRRRCVPNGEIGVSESSPVPRLVRLKMEGRRKEGRKKGGKERRKEGGREGRKEKLGLLHACYVRRTKTRFWVVQYRTVQ